MTLKDQFEQLKKDAEAELAFLKDEKTWEHVRTEYLGRKGKLADLMKELKSAAEQEKPFLGEMANRAKRELTDAFEKARRNVTGKRNEHAAFDVTLPGATFSTGHEHPLTTMQSEVADIFRSLNFSVVEGVELEDEWHNFEALNIPSTHPARDIQDTFFVKGDAGEKGRRVMRTHTSNMQIRVMETYTPPIRAVVIGRVFRNEATDASHQHSFHQVEGFVVDEHISIANLVHTLQAMLSGVFQKQVTVRLRPSYFPFVEPGFELDFACVNCNGRGCSVCKRSGWVEMLGCGMIHPNVFKAVGYPRGTYTGFAFGMGLERLAMMRYGIDDIRHFLGGDIRFLQQF
ncbi:MAG: phenylalanine--tRNA ligase subunit alpha [Candidatus Kerfeldbacteria bacterium]|nr:phenylalanine--tRNA ligase subunit alpha [Candidatus Kerfeldbacteria bacterium]